MQKFGIGDRGFGILFQKAPGSMKEQDGILCMKGLGVRGNYDLLVVVRNVAGYRS